MQPLWIFPAVHYHFFKICIYVVACVVKQLVMVYRLKKNMLPQHKYTMDRTYIGNIRKFNVQFQQLYNISK